MKGQYFSFDAIIATVIMVLAMASLVGYWFGTQAVVESRTNSLYADSLRVADSLLSPGVPANWSGEPSLGTVYQIGLTNGIGNQLNRSKIIKLRDYAEQTSNYTGVGKIMRAAANYYIVIEQTDMKTGGESYSIGNPVASNASEVAVANRGGTLEGKPVRVRVFLWR